MNSFDNESVDPNAFIASYTRYGDNNLDGTVDIGNDFGLLLDGLAAKGSTWIQGDYTYDGKVDLGNDVDLFLISYLGGQAQSTGDLSGVSQPAAISPAVKSAAPIVAAPPAVVIIPISTGDGGLKDGGSLFDELTGVNQHRSLQKRPSLLARSAENLSTKMERETSADLSGERQWPRTGCFHYAEKMSMVWPGMDNRLRSPVKRLSIGEERMWTFLIVVAKLAFIWAFSLASILAIHFLVSGSFFS